MKLDLTCPVELCQYMLDDAPECTFVLNNLSQKTVSSILLTLFAYDAENRQVLRQSERFQGLDAATGERFNVLMVPTHWENVAEVEPIIEKVWFTDQTVWRKGNAPLVSYSPNVISSSRALDELRFVAGGDAVGYPERHRDYWLCVCGRPNLPDAEYCCRCGRGQVSVFASFSKENVSRIIAVHEKKLTDLSQEAREQNSRMNESAKVIRKSRIKRKRRIVAAVTAGAVLAAGAAAFFIWGLPMLRYQKAQGLMEAGRYQEAAEAFQSLGDYRGAEDMPMECDYQSALSMAMEGEAETRLSGIEMLENMGQYQDAPAQAQKARYLLAQKYMQDGAYEKAMEQFQLLGQYEDSAQRVDECIFLQAGATLAAGNPQAALGLYQMVPQYEGVDVKCSECYYMLGKSAEDQGDYATAASNYLSAGDYLDAAQLQKKCIYMQAAASRDGGDLLQAGNQFLLVADYEDAKAQGEKCIYDYALSMKDAGNYVEAAAAFARLPDYEDSAAQAAQCNYLQGKTLMDEGYYAAAVPFFEAAGDHEDAPALYGVCCRSMADEALEGGNYPLAEELYLLAGDGEGVAEKLQKTRYHLATGLMQQGDYAAAAEKLRLAGDYEDSADMLVRCTYQLGTAAYEAGDYAAAASYFGQIPDYEDSGVWLEKSLELTAGAFTAGGGSPEQAFTLLESLEEGSEAAAGLVEYLLGEGLRLENAGDDEGAAALYQRLGGEEANKRLLGCQYRMAEKLAAEGKNLEAGDLFYALGEYEDAAARAEGCYSAYFGGAAEKARQAVKDGDYALAITTLESMDMTALPQPYADLPQLLKQAHFERGEQLYGEGKPYEAKPHYEAAGDYPGAKGKLSRRAYLILGRWKGSDGEAEFRSDGTCVINGEEMYFRVSNFSLLVGEKPEELHTGFQILQLTEKGLSIRDLRGKKQEDYKYQPVEE